MISARDYGKRLKPPVSQRRVTAMCLKGQIRGAYKIGIAWVIPENAPDVRVIKYRG